MPTIADILAERASKAQEVQKRYQQFHQAFSELCQLDLAINPRLAALTDALYGSTAPSLPAFEFVKPHKINADLSFRKVSKLETLEPIVIAILKQHGPMKTLPLFRHVETTGFDVGGKKPISNLAAHLSHSKLVYNGPEGWQLREDDSQMKTPTVAGGG